MPGGSSVAISGGPSLTGDAADAILGDDEAREDSHGSLLRYLLGDPGAAHLSH